jgi:RNA polymerase sigma-70 factor (ECF subfamily)
MADVLHEVRAACAAEGKAGMFEALKGALTGEDPGAGYATVGASLGVNEGAVKVAVHRLRKRYRETLRARIADTVEDPSDVDDEVRHLFSVLAG